METTVQGPGTLSFWWKVDSTTNADQLSFLINAVTQPTVISGVVDWQQQSYFIATGPQTLRWRFRRNGGTDTNRLAAAWVDQVQFSTGSTLPSFVVQPADQTVLQLSNAVVQVLARGTPPIAYQLFHGTTPYGTPTNTPPLIISNPPPALAGTWTVQASNPAGIGSSAPFNLTVIQTPPANDNFAASFSLSSTNLGYNFGATLEPGESSQVGGASVWWKWVAPQSGIFRAVAQATNLSDVLSLGVYSGASVSALTPLGSTSFGLTNEPNGDAIQTADDIFKATSGTSYAIAVGTASGGGTWFSLWLAFLPPPTNDLFANRTLLVGPSAVDSSQLRTATAEPGEPAHDGFPASNSVWWTWSPPFSGGAMVTVASSSILPRVAVYTGNTLTSLHPVVAGVGGATNVNSGTMVTFQAAAGTAYQIAVDGLFGAVGDVQISVALTVPSIASPSIDSHGKVDLSVQAPPGTSFVIEGSDDLKTWGPIYTGVIPASGTFDFQTSIPPGSQSRFYRVRLN